MQPLTSEPWSLVTSNFEINVNFVFTQHDYVKSNTNSFKSFVCHFFMVIMILVCGIFYKLFF